MTVGAVVRVVVGAIVGLVVGAMIADALMTPERWPWEASVEQIRGAGGTLGAVIGGVLGFIWGRSRPGEND